MPGHRARFVSLFEIIGKKVNDQIKYILKKRFKTSYSITRSGENQKLYEKILMGIEQRQHHRLSLRRQNC